MLGAATAGSKMYHIQASKETLNEGLLLIKGAHNVSQAAAPVSASAGRLTDCYEREELLEFWLKVRCYCLC
jgi:hypothetical protein